MQLTLNMLVTALTRNTTADGVFSNLEIQMEAQRKECSPQKINRAQMVSDTNMAIDFFLRARVVESAMEETSKTREALEKLIDEIEAYSA